jgi:hypothetical protein
MAITETTLRTAYNQAGPLHAHQGLPVTETSAVAEVSLHPDGLDPSALAGPEAATVGPSQGPEASQGLLLAAARALGPRTPALRAVLEQVASDLEASLPPDATLNDLRIALGLAAPEVVHGALATDKGASSGQGKLGDGILLTPEARQNALVGTPDLYFQMNDDSLRRLFAGGELNDDLEAHLLKHPDSRHLDIYRRLAQLEREAALRDNRWKVGSHPIPTALARLAHAKSELGPQHGFDVGGDAYRLHALIRAVNPEGSPLGLQPSGFFFKGRTPLPELAAQWSQLKDKAVAPILAGYAPGRRHSLSAARSDSATKLVQNLNDPLSFARGIGIVTRPLELIVWNRALELGMSVKPTISDCWKNTRIDDDLWDKIPEQKADELARLILSLGGLDAEENDRPIGDAAREFGRFRKTPRKLRHHAPLKEALERLTKPPTLTVEQALSRLAPDSGASLAEKEEALGSLFAGTGVQLREAIAKVVVLGIQPGRRLQVAPETRQALANRLVRRAENVDAAALLLPLLLQLTGPELQEAVAQRDFPSNAETWGQVVEGLENLSKEELGFALNGWSAPERRGPPDRRLLDQLNWASRSKLLRRFSETASGRLDTDELQVWLDRSELAPNGKEDDELKNALLGFLRVNWENGTLSEAQLDQLFASDAGRRLARRAEGQVEEALQRYLGEVEPLTRQAALAQLLDVCAETSVVGRWDLAARALLGIHEAAMRTGMAPGSLELPALPEPAEEVQPEPAATPETPSSLLGTLPELAVPEADPISYDDPEVLAGTAEQRANFLASLPNLVEPGATRGLPDAPEPFLFSKVLLQARGHAASTVKALAADPVEANPIARLTSQTWEETADARDLLDQEGHGGELLSQFLGRLETGEDAAKFARDNPEDTAEDLGRFQGGLMALDLLEGVPKEAPLQALPQVLARAEAILVSLTRTVRPVQGIHVYEELGKAKQLLDAASWIYTLADSPDSAISGLLNKVTVLVNGMHGEGTLQESSQLGMALGTFAPLARALSSAGNGAPTAQDRRIISMLMPADGPPPPESDVLYALVPLLFRDPGPEPERTYGFVRHFSGVTERVGECHTQELDHDPVVRQLQLGALEETNPLRFGAILKGLYKNPNAKSSRVAVGIALCDLVGLPGFQAALRDPGKRLEALNEWERHLRDVTPGADQSDQFTLWRLASKIHWALEADEVLWA